MITKVAWNKGQPWPDERREGISIVDKEKLRREKIGKSQKLRHQKNRDEFKKKTLLFSTVNLANINSHLKGRIGENRVNFLFLTLGKGKWLPFEPEPKTDVKGIDLVLAHIGEVTKIITLQVKTAFTEGIQVRKNIKLGRVAKNHFVLMTRFARDKFDIADSIFLCDSQTIENNSDVFKKTQKGEYIINVGLTTEYGGKKKKGKLDRLIFNKWRLVEEINKKVLDYYRE